MFSYSMLFPLKLSVIFSYFTIFLFLIHGNLFLSMFTYVFVSILRKINTYQLHYYFVCARKSEKSYATRLRKLLCNKYGRGWGV